MIDPLGELQRLEKRTAPRYDKEQAGSCPVCRLGPEAVPSIHGACYGICHCCERYWPLGLHAFTAPPWRVDDAPDELRAVLLLLASYTGPQPDDSTQTPLKGLSSMKPVSTTPPPAARPPLDPRMLQDPKDAELMPGTDLDLRSYLFERVAEILPEYEHLKPAELLGAAHRVWDQLRHEKYNLKQTVEQGLGRNPKISSPVYALRDLIEVLIAAGSLRATLLQKRAAIDATLDLLARLEVRR